MAAPLRNVVCRDLWKFIRKSERNAVRRLCMRKYNQCINANRNLLKLKERGIFQAIFPENSSIELHNALVGKPQCVYCGFDPTADSLHVGNLLAVIALLHSHRAGHQAIALLGGATSQIGDPSGKTAERQMLDMDTIQGNMTSIKDSLENIFQNHQEYFSEGCKKDLHPIRLVNNRDWYAKLNVIDFLASVGRHFRMGTMLGKHSVQSRLASADGMSLTEFTYQVFQAYDWLYLYKHFGCSIQIGGNDQMGNITSGHDLISRVTNQQVYGLTVPLVTTTTGDKLGKTAGNAVWLNKDKTSAFELYQYHIRMPDADVEKCLKLFTFLSEDAIADIMSQQKSHPERRLAQRTLAEKVTLLVHGADGLSSAERCTEALYNKSGQQLAQLTDQELADLFRNAATSEMYLEPGMSVLDMVMKAKCFGRIVDAERVIQAGGLQINHRKVTQPDYVLLPGEHVLPNRITLIRVGKKNYYIIRWLGTGVL